MSVQVWEHFFKPEILSSARALVIKGKITLAQPSDTEVQAYIRSSPPLKIIFKINSVESDTVVADCNCPKSKKAQFCKHIWAALLVINKEKPEFLESKMDLEKKTAPLSKRSESQAANKTRQTEFRRQQYQKQKQRLKELKVSKKIAAEAGVFPAPVEKALNYFLENGFSMRASLSTEAIGVAKKKLSRVFHPDFGGDHGEILELNKFADILMKFLR